MRRYNDELMHYGILGMKWGVRRYQNKDGTLTAAGRRKYRKALKEHRANLMKEYGQLEDRYTYGPNANKHKNIQLDKRMREIDDELSYRKKNKNYTDKQRSLDNQLFGYGAERSINKRMNKGYSHGQATRRVYGERVATALPISLALMDVATRGRLHRTVGKGIKSAMKRRR